MQIVIPISDTGAHPLEIVDGRTIVGHAAGMFPNATDFLFICTRVQLENPELTAELRRLVPTSRVVAIEPHKLGPVYSILQAAGAIGDDAPVIVSRCDFVAGSDFTHFQSAVQREDCDGAVVAHRGFHPAWRERKWATYLHQSDGRLVESRDRRDVASSDSGEYVASGVYYFRTGALLKRYLHNAVALGLNTEGEYHVGLPCNLMVQDGLTVSIHKLGRFAEWSTPEDLDEYRRWSEFFSRWADWHPLRATAHTTLLPMAGEGREPQALADVAGAPMIARVLQTLPDSLQTMAMCRTEHLKNTSLSGVLRAERPGTRTIGLAKATAGQSCLCLMPEASLDSRRPVLIAPCDSSSIYGEYALAALTGSADCVAFTFRDYAPANGNPQQYNWVSTNSDGAIEDVHLQATPAGDVREARGLTGMFWFREAGVMFDAIRDWVESGRRNIDAFDLSLILVPLIERGFSVCAFDVWHYTSYSNPQDLRTYEYWNAWFRARNRREVPEPVEVAGAALV